MFVIDNSLAGRDFDGVTGEIESIVKKHGGSVADIRKWDERRLAYEINHVKRATYILAHFELEPAVIELMRLDFALSEKILRQLIVIDIDGVPTGDERPGITSTITDLSGAGRRGRFGERRRPAAGAEATPAAAAGEEAKAPEAPAEAEVEKAEGAKAEPEAAVDAEEAQQT